MSEIFELYKPQGSRELEQANDKSAILSAEFLEQFKGLMDDETIEDLYKQRYTGAVIHLLMKVIQNQEARIADLEANCVRIDPTLLDKFKEIEESYLQEKDAQP